MRADGDGSMRSRRTPLVQLLAIALTAPVAAFGLLTAATKQSLPDLTLTAAWCALIWLVYRLVLTKL